MRIGWLADNPGYQGGAELTTAAFGKAAPAGYSIVPCTPGNIAEDVDAYVVHNCASFDASIIPILERKPVVKTVYDVWKYADIRLKAWLLEMADKVVFVSPELPKWLRLDIPVERFAYVPSPIDVARFEKHAGQSKVGTLWLGRMYEGKGLEAVQRWAADTGTQVDYYGFGPLSAMLGATYKGQVAYEDVPAVMGKYDQFVFLPEELDPCPRVTFEAWAAGCNIITNGCNGAVWWIDNDPKSIPIAAQMLWDVVKAVIE